ncbi:helix-turn-helix transcriptional regulator [Marinobacter sp.]|jgi:AraC-like DNA-binding protein|uniref:helix-turn-helix transcriptional regulator n=1 Tax=Marinobacter sp. TaxID=50741 RepID=UPI00199843F8|nr:helix-turn-helix transcriptional regulator [Marinobacter sp.]MBC7192589.1 helix-turn-helix transcriptional regulator [Marinobacter sp.]
MELPGKQPGLPLAERVAGLITAGLEKGRIGVEQVSSQLNMSRYTLHKRLREENLTFAALLEQVRREQALRYLGDGNRTLVEIAELLGFSELSAFSRAFKRWMGTPPGEFRLLRDSLSAGSAGAAQ